MNTNRDLEIMKLAVDSEVRRAAAKNDMYDQQRAINNAIAMGVSRKSDFEKDEGFGEDTEHLLTREREAQEALGYDV
jgi:hypothetical protein